MSTPRLGKLPPRYTFLLNPHISLRLSKCPFCDKLTYPRKFGLLIAVQDTMPYVQGKTCKYCSRCEMVICDQLELETEMTRAFMAREPQAIGREYLVVGTVALKYFKQGLDNPMGVDDPIAVLADFKKHTNFDLDPGGWRRIGSPPRIITAAEARKRLPTPWKKLP